MKIAILSRKRTLYTTGRFIETARSMGHEPVVLDPVKCFLVLARRSPRIYYGAADRPLPPMDLVIPRIGASVTEHGLAVVNQFDMMGVPIVNNSQPIARSRDKLRCFQLLTRKNINIPRTVMAREPHQIGPALEAVGGPPVVLKLIRGTQGIGVILAETEQAVLSVLDTLWSLGQSILIQEFISESEGKDIRALVVGNRVVTAMRRQARFGEFRSNIHRGGGGTIVDLDDDYRRAAVQATQVLGLQVAGVDLLESHEGPKVMEINSSVGFEGLEKATGLDIARIILEYAVRYARRSGREPWPKS
ncbi:MAG TPA: RimK family alpha-L-glutamate ligase [Candidatus Polarisedimenticolia bacterium]|nr:RimK family alpha-L-glutamate ligase [Candidatus Polarisedimenticolia bacterium]